MHSKNKEEIVVFWFRQDLRVCDNPGLNAAANSGKIMPIYILDPDIEIGEASKVWLYHSLSKLNESLSNKLNLYIGKSEEIIKQIVQKNSVKAVYWNRCYEPERIKKDGNIKEFLNKAGIEAKSFKGSLIWEPWEVKKDDGEFYKVYTHFYKKSLTVEVRDTLPKPSNLQLVKDQNNINNIDKLNLLPKSKKWHETLISSWNFGENSAQEQLKKFFNSGLEGYSEGRNNPYLAKVSKLSPYLHFGEISPVQIWNKLNVKQYIKPSLDKDIERFKSEIVWREFSYHLLYFFPNLSDKNFKVRFDNFPWRESSYLLESWKRGYTGYPIVDAGMRELWQTGYMHNRIRMVVASFLVKNLAIHWLEGAKWFWNCLFDADLANNSASWQWIAGSGADAAPYFRIFNPVLQGERFDSNGEYTLKFVPELKKLPLKYLFKPWEAPKEVLKKAGVILGVNYPKPIVNLRESASSAMEAYNLYVKNTTYCAHSALLHR